MLDGAHQALPTLTVLDRMAVLVGVLALCVLPLLRIVDASVRSQVSSRLARLARGARADDRGQPVGPNASANAVPHFAWVDPLTSATFPDASGLILTASSLVGAAFTSWSNGGSVPVLLAAFSASLVVSVTAAHLTSTGASWAVRRALTVNVVWCAHVLISLAIWLGAFHLGGMGSGPRSGIPFPRGIHIVVPQILLAVATFRSGGIVILALQWTAMFERLWEGLPRESSRSGDDVGDTTCPAGAPAMPVPHAPLLRVRRVVLRLADIRDRLLSELDFDLNDGEHVAFVGPPGVGKTTLIRALLGRLNTSSGTILYRGRSLGEYGQSEREQLVSGMAQSDRLPDSTISRLLRAGSVHASPSQLREVCAHLGFDEEFSRMPLGYDTPVSHDGDTLSRGQRQMLLLARAVASGARILALDDPVNSLDDATARRVLAGLAALPCAVVLTMASASALCDLDFRVIHLDDVLPRDAGTVTGEERVSSGSAAL
ncbi:MAG TPA: ATP-binding cassette domain-containing protein [Gemmatimonadaceae bacterium]|nr:ATP-binding cassette domain-containing protein [Gemmatimonadaceae bacterium]